MTTKNSKVKSVTEFNAGEKRKQLAAELEKDKNERLQKFIAEYNELVKKHNCQLISQVIIEGDRLMGRVVPVAG